MYMCIYRKGKQEFKTILQFKTQSGVTDYAETKIGI